MALDVKISAYPTNATPISTDILVTVNSSTTKKMTTGSMLRALGVGSVSAPSLRFGSDVESGLYYDSAGAKLHGVISASSSFYVQSAGIVAKALEIENPARTFNYQFVASAIVANRTITMPLLTGNDTLALADFTQTLTNKTLNTPTIGDLSNATHDHSDAANGGAISFLTSPMTTRGDIIVRDATSPIRLSLGTVGQALVSDGTDIGYSLAKVLQADGSVDLTAVQVGVDPTAANHLATKGYVDGGKNLIINGGFQVNQRAYVSGTNTADLAYMHDRWRSSAANSDYAFSVASPSSPQTITIAANAGIEQVIEGTNIGTAGTHTISWTGTATARAVVNTQTTSGNFAVSPITVTAVLDQVITIEFTGADAVGGATLATNTGTLGKVQCELGSVATPFEHRHEGLEEFLCKRYYERFNFDSANFENITDCFTNISTNARASLQLSEKRVPPTASTSAISTFNVLISGTSLALSGLVLSDIGKRVLALSFTIPTTTAGLSGYVRRNSTNVCYIAADSEL